MNTATVSTETLIELVSTEEHHCGQLREIKRIIANDFAIKAVKQIADMLGVESYEEKWEKEREAEKLAKEAEKQAKEEKETEDAGN